VNFLAALQRAARARTNIDFRSRYPFLFYERKCMSAYGKVRSKRSGECREPVQSNGYFNR
jgi:hypothetical protein